MAIHHSTESFSISHAMILDGVTRAEDVALVQTDGAAGDIYGVEAGTITADIASFDNNGDDTVRSRWYWLNFATVEIRAGFISWDVYTDLTGESITESSVGGGGTIYRAPLWTTRSMNVAPKPLLLRCPAKTAAGALRYLDFVLYKVQFSPISFQGPEYKTGMKINYSGTGLATTLDETGNTVIEAVGALLDRPAS